MPQLTNAASAVRSVTCLDSPADRAFRVIEDLNFVVPVVKFAIKEGYFADEEIAKSHLHATVQWLIAHGASEHADHIYLMFEGPVDHAYHALMLNSKLYLTLCREQVGFYVHHTPLDASDYALDDLEKGVDYTVGFLEKTYGGDLAEPLKEWSVMRAAGQLTANSVSCVSNGLSDSEQLLMNIPSFRTFWDRNSADTVVQ